MPITLEYVETLHIIIATATGVMSFGELLRFVSTDWKSAEHPILLDTTQANATHMSGDEVRKLADTAAALLVGRQVHMKLAIVAAGGVEFGLARMFQSLTDVGGASVRVFRSVPEAAAWLA